MEQFQLLVTEITRYGKLFCVAGWDLKQKRMIRPRSAQPPHFWDSRFCGQNNVFQTGNIVSFSGMAEKNAPFPHASENYQVTSKYITSQQQCNEQAVVTELKNNNSISLSLIGTFRGNLVKAQKPYIPLGTKCNSLDGITVPAQDFAFSYASGKLRGIIYENDYSYCPTITSHDTKILWETNGVKHLENYKQNFRYLHLRLGVAQACNYGKCYLQINGVYFIN